MAKSSVLMPRSSNSCAIAGCDAEKVFERVSAFLEQIAVVFEEFLGDFFDAESGFERGDGGIGVVCLQQFEKLLLRGVAIFVFADEIAVTAGRRQLRPLGDDAEFGLFEGEVEFDEGEPPVVLGGRNERGDDSGLCPVRGRWRGSRRRSCAASRDRAQAWCLCAGE